MEKHYIKSYQYILGIFLLLTGILFFVLLSSPFRYLGIVFLTLAYLYFVSIFYSKFSDADDKHFRSRTRDQILKHQFRK